MGYQQPIKSAVLAPPVEPPPERLKLPEIANYGKGPAKSQEAHRVLRTKHTRQPNDAHELFRIPVATTMDYGKKNAGHEGEKYNPMRHVSIVTHP